MNHRQKQVADLLLEGKCAKEIGVIIGVETRTVKKYKAELFEMYGIRDGHKCLKLCVALYYERNPEKRIPARYKLTTEQFILLGGK